MNTAPSQIYLDYPAHSVSVLERRLKKGLDSRIDSVPVPIYFRADDIGVLSTPFETLINLFNGYRIPLCLAVVPAWLTSQRVSAISQLCEMSSSLWCWHQHGWQHKNHQRSGKKGEFGSDRSAAAIKNDILKGRDRLKALLGPSFAPFFTPPWNRCSDETLNQLAQAGFQAISTDQSRDRHRVSPLPDLAVNVDLHTRREPDAESCLQGLASELESAARMGAIGVMIHHQRMNSSSFTLLEGLFKIIVRTPELIPVNFHSLLQ